MLNAVPCAPLIVRLGGLPVDAVAPFSSSLGERLDGIHEVGTKLAKVRTGLVDRLHDLVRTCDPGSRHMLLALKRDCFNGRPLHRRRTDELVRLAGPEAPALQHALDLEGAVDESRRTFGAAYEQQKAREQRHLRACAADPALLCGIGLTSSVLYRELRLFAAARPEQWGKRERRVAATLLRYLSRAALKLSPLSTFTRVGLCRVRNGDAATRLEGGPWSSRSLVRARRHLLDRSVDLLLHVPQWRETLPVILNDSILPTDEGRVLLRRPGSYAVIPGALKIAYRHEALVRIPWTGPTALFLEKTLDRPVCYRELVSALVAASPDHLSRTEAARELDKYLELGALQFVLPWNDAEPRVEAAMLRELRSSPASGLLEKVLANLSELIALGETFLDASDHGAAASKLNDLLTELLKNAAAAAGVPDEVDVSSRPSTHDIYQDVWCQPQDNPSAAVASVGRVQLEKAHQSVEPFIRYAAILNHRVDFQLGLSDLLRAGQCHTTGVPVLAAFTLARSLWRDYCDFRNQLGDSPRYTACFNPRGVPSISELGQWREYLIDGFPRCCSIDGAMRIDPARLTSLLARVPSRYTPGDTGACLFLQPANAGGSLWVQNGIREGTGRFGSRYSVLMDCGLQAEFLSNLMSRASFTVDGEPVEFLEIYCVNGDTLNVHKPQTPKVLVLPGTRVDLESGRKLRLADLLVSAPPDGQCQLRDRTGRRYIPVHLGLSSQRYMPNLVRFLCSFGPTGSFVPFPERTARQLADDLTVLDRTVIGNVVLQRKCWRIPAHHICELLGVDAPEDGFEALHRFRQKHAIPGRVFVSEPVGTQAAGDHTKPQYLDLTSPSFVSLLEGIAQSAKDQLVFTEMLPDFDAFPTDDTGRRWAVELLADSLAMRPQIRRAPPPPQEAGLELACAASKL